LQFVRVYRNQDERSRTFGIGANDSLDIFLTGQMGSYVDLILVDGGRVHFTHSLVLGLGDTYVARGGGDYTTAVYRGDTWTISRKDGWKFFMPYRPKALGQNVTVLTGFSDPAGHLYRMERDASGDLLSITTPSGDWLHFEHDSGHRVSGIESSGGRTVHYDYDSAGCLSRVADSEGHIMNYVYDDKAQMVSVSRGTEEPILRNTYDSRGNIKTQVMADRQSFEYRYVESNWSGKPGLVADRISTPNGLVTFLRYGYGQYEQSLPVPRSH
jgi:YD repeat-containing protein